MAFVFVIILFVIFYVAQNVQITRMKIENRANVKKAEEIAKLNDRLLLEIERARSLKVMDRLARERGWQRITPENFDVIDMSSNNGKR